MEIRRKFFVAVDEPTARQRAVDYMVRAGHALVADSPWLRFLRGRKHAWLYAFDPNRYGVTVRIEFLSGPTSTRVEVFYTVVMLGDLVTRKTAAFWHAELDSLEASVRGTEPPAVPPEKLAHKAKVEALVAAAIYLSIVLAVAVGIVMEVLGWDFPVPVLLGTYVAATLLLILWVKYWS